MSKDEQILKNHFHDLAYRAYQRGIPVFTDFLEKYQVQLALQAANKAGVSIAGYGGYPDALRQVLCFYTPNQKGGLDDQFMTDNTNQYLDVSITRDFADTLNYPVKCIRIAPVNKHFHDKLSHRDYLGSIMNLGIDRNQVGDIIVKREGNAGDEIPVAYVFCITNKSEMIESLTCIKHTTVTAKTYEGQGLSLQQDYNVFDGSVSSYRLDAILSASLRISRGQCIGLIQEGKILLNGKICTENAKQVNNRDVISARGYGKYLIETSQTVSRKGRLHIRVKQYV